MENADQGAHQGSVGDLMCPGPAQLALAWVLAQGDDIVPIPGTKRRQYPEENVGALDFRLTPEVLTEIDSLIPPGAAAGSRYSEPGMRAINR